MNLIEYFSNSDSNDVILLLHTLLNRIPITISGDNEEEIESIINEILSLIPFRNVQIYYTDFTDVNDFNSFNENEQQDYDIQRSVYVSYPYASDKLIEEFSNFDSWIIGIMELDNDLGLLERIKSKIYHCQPYFLHIELKGKNFFPKLKAKHFLILIYSLRNG